MEKKTTEKKLEFNSSINHPLNHSLFTKERITDGSTEAAHICVFGSIA